MVEVRIVFIVCVFLFGTHIVYYRGWITSLLAAGDAIIQRRTIGVGSEPPSLIMVIT